MSNTNKTLLLILPHNTSFRDIYLSNLLDKLTSNYNVKVLLPSSFNPEMVNYFTQKKLQIFYLNNYIKPGYLNNILYAFFNRMAEKMGAYHLIRTANIETLKIFKYKQSIHSPIKSFIYKLLWLGIFRNKKLFNILIKLRAHFLNTTFAKNTISIINPQIVLVFDVYSKTHGHFLEILNNQTKIKTIGIIRSWDNISAKGYLFYEFTYYFVWNNFMRKELIKYYSINKHKIFCVGSLQFDYYINFLGKKPNNTNKQIVFMLSYPDDRPQMIEFICYMHKLINDNFRKSHLIIRVQPGGRSKEIADYLKKNNINVEISGINTVVKGSKLIHKMIEMNKEFCQLMNKADLVINFTSTTTIDCAINDVPNITIAYEIDRTTSINPLHLSYYPNRTHYQNISKIKYNDIAYSEEELINLIHIYLKTKINKGKERNNLLKSICHINIGESANEYRHTLDKILNE